MESEVDAFLWIKVGQVGAAIAFLKEQGVSKVVMAGGISRVKAFRDVKLDARGALLLARIRSTKDDKIMRGVAEELSLEGMEVVHSTAFLTDAIVQPGLVAGSPLSEEQISDVELGRELIKAMTGYHVGQLVVIKNGVVVAVEAVEGSDDAIRRGGQLGGTDTVVVKCAKPDQDMRFDVPMVGKKTIEVMNEVGAKVLAVEAGRSIVVDKENVLKLAAEMGISIYGCEPIVNA